MDAEAQQISDQLDTELMQLETLDLAPKKTDTVVDQVAILWLPYLEDAAGNVQRAF